jgi:predicted metal-dependent phosphoesterase TrpH
MLAHPVLIGDDSQIEHLVAHGLMGIEAYYPAHSFEDIERYVSIARKHKLLITGGTDWHGWFSQWDVELGGQGVNKEHYEVLRNKRL